MADSGSDGTLKRGGRGKPNPIDVHVGSRVRLRRTLLGMSQEKLARAVGLTLQQEEAITAFEEQRPGWLRAS